MSEAPGPIRWMAKNSVAANLLMAILIIGGGIIGSSLKQEVFPEFELDTIRITIPYPGASPSEVEQGIVLAVEEAVRGIDGVKKVDSVAGEGSATVSAELILGSDGSEVLADVKSAVDRIRTFPQDAERPIVDLVQTRREVISLVIYGEHPEGSLRELAEEARLGLLADPRITVVELAGVRPREIGVEVPQAALRAHDLTLEAIAGAIQRSSLELPGGGIKTGGGEVLLRLDQRRDRGAEFAEVVVKTTDEGAPVTVGDLAEINDGFADTDQSASYNGKPAVMVKAYRVGEQTPIDVADAVREYVKKNGDLVPQGVGLATVNDQSEVFRDRMDLLMRNAMLGLVLVLLTLGAFLEARLAFWVTMGIPVSFLGSFLIIGGTDVSFNMISMFAFIVTLGMVVDDAIIVGENIFDNLENGVPPMTAAVSGARQVATPVVFSVLTTIAAFMPLLFVSGFMGKIFKNIPMVVVPVLAVSLIESLFVLPAHLGHLSSRPPGAVRRVLRAARNRSARALAWLIERTYAPTLRRALDRRYLTAAVAVAILMVAVGYIRGGRIDITFMPKVDADDVTASVVMPFGIAVNETEAVRDQLILAAWEVAEESGGRQIVEGIFSEVGKKAIGRGAHAMLASASGGSHLAYVKVFLVDADQRNISGGDFGRRWREKVKDIAGPEMLAFAAEIGAGGGAAIDVQLKHQDIGVLEAAAGELARGLASFSGVRDIDDGFTRGKPQLSFSVRPEGHAVGLTGADIGRQVRSAFYGAEALRQQRGRDELKVMVRLPERERASLYDVEELMVRTSAGGEVPLLATADVHRGYSYTSIARTDGRRVVNVTAEVVQGQGNADKILAGLKDDVLPDLVAAHPGLTYSFEGQNRSRAEAMGDLMLGFALALIVIYGLLAIPFKSYIQPAMVMSAIPFGMVGALIGHIVVGYDLSLISMFGVVALSGVVVNDSLVLVATANELRESGDTRNAVEGAAIRRFRPILLTSLTTFLGLTPMILETSAQARFLIPMAISLGFGVLFSTFITLLLVPALYLIIEDVLAFVQDIWGTPTLESQTDA